MKKVVAIGIFDGVHAGHQQIISAAKHHGEVTVITFDPHPTSVIAPERTPTQLVSLKDRSLLLKKAGANSVEVITFNKDFASLSPDQFIEDILIGRFSAEHLHYTSTRSSFHPLPLIHRKRVRNHGMQFQQG